MAVNGRADLPTVLFLCVHNAGRSQMALGWFDSLAGGRARAYAARFGTGRCGQSRRRSR